jgi:uncharacterized OsmC-like protein
MDLRALQRPLKDRYRSDPSTSKIRLEARASQSTVPVSCSVDLGRAVYAAEAHSGVGGPGTGACSGDLLLGALAACAQITCQMVATAMGIPIRSVEVVVSGELDLRGTLGIARDVPVGFEWINCRFDIDAPDALPDQIDALRERTERYCVVFQTLNSSPRVESTWSTAPSQAALE